MGRLDGVSKRSWGMAVLMMISTWGAVDWRAAISAVIVHCG